MGANCAVIAIDGRWSGCSHGYTTSADSSHDGNTTSRTSSDSFTSAAFTYYSDIYETASSILDESDIQRIRRKNIAIEIVHALVELISGSQYPVITSCIDRFKSGLPSP